MAKSKNKVLKQQEEERLRQMEIENDIEGSEPTDEELDDMEDELEDEKVDNMEEQILDQQEMTEEMANDYGSPESEEKHTPHTIINKAMFTQEDTVRMTFLTESELGRPLFSVRFMMDLEKHAQHFGLDRIVSYYKNKRENTTSTGLSNKGFGMNLNVTQKRDSTRRRVRDKPMELNKK